MISSYLDFPAVYDQSCEKTGDYLCDDAWTCTASVKRDLLERYGRSIAPVQPERGYLTATCAWIPYDMPRIDSPVPTYLWEKSVTYALQDADKAAAKGYCALTSAPNPRYVPGHCKAIASPDHAGAQTVYTPYIHGNQKYTNTTNFGTSKAADLAYGYSLVYPPDANNPVSTGKAGHISSTT